MRFIADCNVGKLARWLRILGYDTLFVGHADDDTVLRIALKEGRVILTRDNHFLQRRVYATGQVKVVFLLSEVPMVQVAQVVRDLRLDWQSGQFSRCLECNVPLQSRAPEEVVDQVPPYVYHTQSAFAQCPGCGRIYWHGTHWQRMRQELQALSAAA